MAKELYGIIPPMTTPFTEGGDVYEKGVRELVDFQVKGGSHGLFICGTYGSGPLMTTEQRKQVHELVVDQAAGRVVVVAHVGSARTDEAVELAKHAESVGADYISSISPFYLSHDDRTVTEYFRQLVEAVSIPVYVYNNPSATKVVVSGSLLRSLEGVGVQGIKDSGFNYIDFTHLVLAMQDKPDFRFIVGTEGISFPAWAVGAKGCVSGLANAFPELMVKQWDLFQAGDYKAAGELQLKVNRARQVLHIPSSTNAACYAALHARGVDAGYPKRPVLPVTDDKREAMLAAFREMGLL